MNHEQTLKELIELVIGEGGSDLHLSSSRKPSVRITGQLSILEKYPEFTEDDMKKFITVLTDDTRTKDFLEHRELDFAYNFDGKTRLRGNAFYHQGDIGIALRLIPEVKKIQDLNLPEVLLQFTQRKQGFFLVVGPVGQGKTTTLASLIDAIKESRGEHIITIEDPIEYVFKPKRSLIEQREVRVDTEDFASALKGVFRQDANVIMIGEMRGPDTMAAAVTAAETGHLVFSTLHTNNASQTIDRIIDSFPAEQQNQIRAQLSNTLLGIFSQRLIPRLSGGLIPAYELLINNGAVANLIREKRTHEIEIVIETGSSQGMIDMNHSLAELVIKKEISIESARLHTLNQRALDQLL